MPVLSNLNLRIFYYSFLPQLFYVKWKYKNPSNHHAKAQGYTGDNHFGCLNNTTMLSIHCDLK